MCVVVLSNDVVDTKGFEKLAGIARISRVRSLFGSLSSIDDVCQRLESSLPLVAPVRRCPCPWLLLSVDVVVVVVDGLRWSSMVDDDCQWSAMVVDGRLVVDVAKNWPGGALIA